MSASLPQKLTRAWRTPLQVFIAARCASWVAGALALSAFPARELLTHQGYVKGHYGKLLELFAGAWERGDGMWYLSIAQNGYVEPASRAFMPLYPLLIRVLDWLIPGPSILTALLISNAAFFLGLHFTYCLARDEFEDEAAAKRGLWYLAFFPGSVFFFAPYTESLFLCLAAGSLWKARKGNWAAAALLGCCLGATRNVGAAIGIPLALELYRQIRAKRANWASMAWLLLVPLGLLAWIIYCGRSTGDPLAFVHEQAQWQRQPLAPWLTLLGGIQQAWDDSLGYPGAGYVIEAFAVVGAFLLTIRAMWGRVRLSLPLLAFSWLMLVPPLLAPFEGRMLMSCARFVAVVFPVFIALGAWIKREWADEALRASLLAAYGIAAAMYVTNHYFF